MRFSLTVLVLLLSGCAPHYREDADRARRALDAEQMQDLLDAAQEQAASGDHEGAAAAYVAAIDANPRFGASVYLALARELVDAGDPLRAVAVTRFVVQNRSSELGDGGGGPGPLDEVAARLAAANLPALAIEVLALRNPGLADPSAVTRLPELGRHLGSLVQAREHARGGRSYEAMRAYWRWASEYGVADHEVLRAWAAEVLSGQVGAADVVRESAQRAAAAGDFVLAARAHGLLLLYEPRLGPSQAAPLAEASRQAGELLRLGPEAAQRVDEGTRAADEGQIGAAIHAYRRAVLEAPWSPELRRNLATLLAAVGLYGEAVRQGEWMLALGPDDVPMREQIAVWRTQGQAP